MPLLVVQGENDRFGVPAGAVVIAGDHGLKQDTAAVAAAVSGWLVTAVATAIPASAG